MTLRIACTVSSLLLVATANASPQGGTGCPQIGAQLCVPLDASFSTVPFFGTCGRNDDDSAQLMLSGWTFDFYGTPWGDVYVNNNGNVSFGTPFSTFSASGFPVAGFPMVAPFWADVDTRADSGNDGVVWFREWSIQGGDAVNRLVITWDNVGYYNQQTDKLNTFQLILTDGADDLIGVGNNVCFCYGDMQWTTGSASSGTGGFGGVPATAGANEGNGVDFFQIGRFDQPGNAYDGPGGASDGVDYLDGQTICFSIGASGGNVPPIFVNATDTYQVAVGDVLMFDVEAIGPETNQTVSMLVDPMGLANVSSSTTPGNPAIASVTFTPDSSQIGSAVVRITATDDGSPPESATLDVTIDVVDGGKGDTAPPLCTVIQTAPGLVDGEARDDRPGDTGIDSIVLDPAATNIVLFVDPFTSGDGVVRWMAGREDSMQPGLGDVIVTDVAGNTTMCPVELSPPGDCNANGVPDAADIAAFTSFDWNANGVPDECDQIGRVYCTPQNHNSTGLPGFLLVTGSNRIADNDLELTTYSAPRASFGFFLISTEPDFIPAWFTLSSGNLCLAAPRGGYFSEVRRSGPTGRYALSPDISVGIPYASQPGGVLMLEPGMTVYFQSWFRDRAALLRGNNLTDAVAVTFL